jgi:hypothetical protein
MPARLRPSQPLAFGAWWGLGAAETAHIATSLPVGDLVAWWAYVAGGRTTHPRRRAYAAV